jgi:peptide/nickel transport system ATP-binding protein/oligopeptide transport system ATP-binding protein
MLLEVTDLRTHFFTEEGTVRAVDGVSFSLARGSVLGVVGESGSGKSVMSLSLLRLIPDPPGRLVSGEILLESRGGAAEDLARAPEARMRAIRGDRIAMIFQDPMTSLNPYLKVSEQLVEVLTLHKRMGRKAARERSVEMLAAVGIPAPASRIDDYPHQLSGGMRQRVMIAMALLCEPDLLIADEPTTALDVTVQAQILELIQDRKEAMGLGVILITHDLGVIAKMADHVAVMYAGRIVEQGPAEQIFADPRHPYTIGLARSIPRLDQGRGSKLTPIPGLPPSLARLPPGCPFHPRCAHAIPACQQKYPEARVVSPEHLVRCHVTSVSLSSAAPSSAAPSSAAGAALGAGEGTAP